MNTMSTETRTYTLKARAQAQQETRERIVAAAADLHEELGVARTTVSEIARRAGVSRLTVYNHFPDLAALLPACSAHYLARHPLPDFGPALAKADPEARVREVLRLLYERYEDTAAMTGGIFTDRESVPELDEFFGATRDVQAAQLADALVGGFGPKGRRAARTRALVMVALDFWTWRSLNREGLANREAAEVMASGIAQAAAA
jgi:AcrR family transcriptional regulator